MGRAVASPVLAMKPQHVPVLARGIGEGPGRGERVLAKHGLGWVENYGCISLQGDVGPVTSGDPVGKPFHRKVQADVLPSVRPVKVNGTKAVRSTSLLERS